MTKATNEKPQMNWDGTGTQQPSNKVSRVDPCFCDCHGWPTRCGEVEDCETCMEDGSRGGLLITYLRTEADLCKNESATDVAKLLDMAADEIEGLHKVLASIRRTARTDDQDWKTGCERIADMVDQEL